MHYSLLHIGCSVTLSPKTLHLRTPGHAPDNTFLGKFSLFNNLLKYTNLEINVEENLTILPCKNHRGQKIY